MCMDGYIHTVFVDKLFDSHNLVPHSMQKARANKITLSENLPTGSMASLEGTAFRVRKCHESQRNGGVWQGPQHLSRTAQDAQDGSRWNDSKSLTRLWGTVHADAAAAQAPKGHPTWGAMEIGSQLQIGWLDSFWCLYTLSSLPCTSLPLSLQAFTRYTCSLKL